MDDYDAPVRGKIDSEGRTPAALALQLYTKMPSYNTKKQSAHHISEFLNAKTPGKPTGLHLSKYTADWVFFAWEPPEDSGGFPIDVHRLQFRPVEKLGSKRWVELNKKLKMPEIQVTSDVLVKHGIHGGVTYEFRCCSRTRRGWGEWSEPYRIECPGYRERLGGEQKSEVSLSKKAPPRRINSKTGTAALPKVIKKVGI